MLGRIVTHGDIINDRKGQHLTPVARYREKARAAAAPAWRVCSRSPEIAQMHDAEPFCAEHESRVCTEVGEQGLARQASSAVEEESWNRRSWRYHHTTQRHRLR
jgi:hypothetical protein